MPTLSTRHQLILATMLIAFLLITRAHNLIQIDWLPSATIAGFFLMGVYFRQLWLLTLSFIIVWTADISGLTWSGGSHFCLSNSYAFLLASYAVYWLGGQVFARVYNGNTLRSLIALSVIAPISGALGYFVSSSSFHYLSGLFEPNFSVMFNEFLMRLPTHLAGLAIYLVMAVVAHLVITSRAHLLNQPKQA